MSTIWGRAHLYPGTCRYFIIKSDNVLDILQYSETILTFQSSTELLLGLQKRLRLSTLSRLPFSPAPDLRASS